MSKKPDITISSLDTERLENLLASLKDDDASRVALEAELVRATVLDPHDMPPNVVTMNSTVKFTVTASNEEFELTLVYPKDMDASGKTVSILAPIGTALLGLSQGAEIDWPKPNGGTTHVTVKEITYQPERSGTFFR